MSTLDLAANNWIRTTLTPTNLVLWMQAREIESASPPVDEADSDLASDSDLVTHDLEKRELPENFWQDWFGVWR